MRISAEQLFLSLELKLVKIWISMFATWVHLQSFEPAALSHFVLSSTHLPAARLDQHTENLKKHQFNASTHDDDVDYCAIVARAAKTCERVTFKHTKTERRREIDAVEVIASNFTPARNFQPNETSTGLNQSAANLSRTFHLMELFAGSANWLASNVDWY